MIFTDASQPTSLDPWDLPASSDTLNEDELIATAIVEEQEQGMSATIPQEPIKRLSGWRNMLADIQRGLQWGLRH